MSRTASSLTRREFLTRSAAGVGGPLIVPSRSAFGYPANERINLAVIGHIYVADHFYTSVHSYPNVEIVALCDPDEPRVYERAKKWQEQAQKVAASGRSDERRTAEYYGRLWKNRPPVYADFRQMLQELDGRIDAVVVSMFEHYHGPACGAAMRSGKHVFCERPLGLTIRESRPLRELAASQKVATSIRNPGNASNQFRRGVELLRAGVLGAVEEVHAWWEEGAADRQQPPQGAPPTPEGLHWDLWLGPAAERPYHPDWMAYATWREFSNGKLGTFGPHSLNLAFLGLRVNELWTSNSAATTPLTIRVRAESSGINRLSFPCWERIVWHVPARGDLRPVKFTWYDGFKHAPDAPESIKGLMRDRGASEEEQTQLLGYAGALLVGKHGSLATDDHNVKFTLLPQKQFQDVQQLRPENIPPSRGHYADWFHACRGGEPALANFDYANALSEFVMLGNLATQFHTELEYDPVAGRIINNEEADRMLGYEYREGWTL